MGMGVRTGVFWVTMSVVLLVAPTITFGFSGVIIGDQLDFSGDSTFVGAQASPIASTTSSFVGRYPAYLHMKINMGGVSGGWNSNVLRLTYWATQTCTGIGQEITEQYLPADNTSFSPTSGYQDVYIDLTGTLAPTTTTKCMQLLDLHNDTGGGSWRVSTNASHTEYFYEFGATLTPTATGTVSVTIGQATSSSLFSGFDATSTLGKLDAQCSQATNLFAEGLCMAGVFLFVPDPATLDDFFALPSVAATKFPFSWIYGVKGQFDVLSASTTSNFASLSLNLASTGVGSTTAIGNILPNFVGFSTTTLLAYIGSGVWNTFQDLISAGLWLGLVLYIYQFARRMVV